MSFTTIPNSISNSSDIINSNGYIWDLTITNTGTWNPGGNYPQTFQGVSSIKFQNNYLELENFNSTTIINNLQELVDYLNLIQDLFIFSVDNTDSILVKDGTWSVNNLSAIELNTDIDSFIWDTTIFQYNGVDNEDSIQDEINHKVSGLLRSLNKIEQRSNEIYSQLSETETRILNEKDASGNAIVSQRSILGSYLMDSNNIANILNRKGTGTQNYSNGVNTMSVTAGQYAVCESYQRHPYFPGFSQEIEITTDNFHSETNVTKKVGLFTTDFGTPYNVNYDGVYIESTGTTHTLVIANGNTGTEVKINSSQWDNQTLSINWNLFNIFKINFLYLGGSQVRFYIFNNGEFKLLHTYKHANQIAGTIFQSPALPVRWEIRSTTGSGSLGQICATVTTAGAQNLVGSQLTTPIYTGSVNANVTGVTYILKAIRLSNTTGKHKTMLNFDVSTLSLTNDNVFVDLRLNGTPAGAALTWTDITDFNGNNTGVQYANPDLVGNPSTTTITGGTMFWGQPISSQGREVHSGDLTLLRHAGFDLDGVADIIYLCATPLNTGTNADVWGNLTVLID